MSAVVHETNEFDISDSDLKVKLATEVFGWKLVKHKSEFSGEEIELWIKPDHEFETWANYHRYYKWLNTEGMLDVIRHLEKEFSIEWSICRALSQDDDKNHYTCDITRLENNNKERTLDIWESDNHSVPRVIAKAAIKFVSLAKTRQVLNCEVHGNYIQYDNYKGCNECRLEVYE